MPKSRPRQLPFLFGELPVRALNATLDLELDAGEVVMSANAQKHAQARHPADFARCFPHVASVVANPLYARDDFLNHGKIELVGSPAGLGDFLLVAVEIILDAQGRYNIASFYPISEKKVARRRDSGHLRRLKRPIDEEDQGAMP